MLNDQNILLKCPYESDVFTYIFLYSICIPGLIIFLESVLLEMICLPLNIHLGNNFVFACICLFFFFFQSLYVLIKIWGNGFKTTYITETGLIIKSPLKRIDYSWSDITEFGRILQDSHYQIMVDHYFKYYIKVGNNKSRIFLTNSVVKNSDEFCHYLFKYAKKAAFRTWKSKIIGYNESEWNPNQPFVDS